MKARWLHFKVSNDARRYLAKLVDRLNSTGGRKVSISRLARGIIEMFVVEQKFWDAGDEYDAKYKTFIRFFEKLEADDDKRLQEIYERRGPLRSPPAFDRSPLDEVDAGDR